MMCDLCGKTTEQTWKTVVEGVALDVCESCTQYGRVLNQPVSIKSTKQPLPQKVTLRPEEEETLVPEYGMVVKRARESRKMNQEDFAKLINEKLSVIQKVERGEFEPPLHVAHKWEKILGIKLIVKNKSTENILSHAENKGGASRLTLGDFVKKKKDEQ